MFNSLFLNYRSPILILVLAFIACKKQPVFEYPPKPEVTVSGGDPRFKNSLIHFAKDTVYIIAGDVSVDSGKLLSIDPGTLVKVNNKIKITIQAGGFIEAKGTEDAPVVFTANTKRGQSGIVSITGDGNIFWGGLSVYGNAISKSSGILSYLRLEFAGANNNSALLLSDVNNKTSINNIQISYANWNAFDIDGGDCNAAYLISFACSGTDFNIRNGHKGKMQNLLSFRDPQLAAGVSNDLNLSAVYIGGSGTSPVISNITIMRPGLIQGINGNYTFGDPYRRSAIIAADNCIFQIRNAVIIGLPAVRKGQSADSSSARDFYLQSASAAGSLDSGRSEISYSNFFQSDSNAFYLPKNTYQNYNSADLRAFLLRPQYHNEIFSTLDQFKFNDPYSYNYYYTSFSPMLNPSSPLLNGANFSGAVFIDPFFKKVNYRGAIGADNWMQGWTNFLPLQTHYNN